MVELMEIIAEIKTYLKTLPGSNLLVNRREPSKKELVHSELETVARKTQRSALNFRYRPLGQILLEAEVITVQQLGTALNKHWSTGQRIGQSIMTLGMASAGDIARALEIQLNVPHFDIRKLEKNLELRQVVDKIPVDLMKERGVVPVKKEQNVISLAMLNPKDIEAMDKVRSFTGCNIAPFFVLESEFSEIFGKTIKKADKGD